MMSRLVAFTLGALVAVAPMMPLPPDALNASACGPQGAPERWLSTSARLSRGEPITILALGSSIVGVHGGCTAPAPLLQTTDCIRRCPRCCGARCGDWGESGGWALNLLNYINATYPVSEAGAAAALARAGARRRASVRAGDPAQHQLYNFGEPGGDLFPAIVACPRTYFVGIEPHIVLLDLFTAEMGATTRHKRGPRVVERLLRMLLALPSRPVVIVLNFAELLHRVFEDGCHHNCWRPGEPLRKFMRVPMIDYLVDVDGANGTVPATRDARVALASALATGRIDAAVAPHRRASFGPLLSHVARTSEALRLAARYGLPLLDIFGCFAPMLAAAVPFDTQRYAHDGTHPSTDGGWLVGAALIDLTARALAATARLRARATTPERPPTAPRLPAAVYADLLPPLVGLSCYTFDRLGYEAALKGISRIRRGAHVEQLTSFVSGPRAGVVPAILPETAGWRFVEREPLSKTPFKPGLVASAAGALLALAIEVPRAHASYVTVAFVRSYQGHGVVSLSCEGECRCAPHALDAHDPRAHTTTQTSAQIVVTPRAAGGRQRRALATTTLVDASGWNASRLYDASMARSAWRAAQCVLRLRVDNATHSDGHRFKVVRLLVEARADDMILSSSSAQLLPQGPQRPPAGLVAGPSTRQVVVS